MKYFLILLTLFTTLFNLSAAEQQNPDEPRKLSRKSRSMPNLFEETSPQSSLPPSIIFSEFEEPETPNLEKITFGNVAFRFRSKAKQPITIVPSGKSFTLDNRDRGDKSHDTLFDALKINLDKKSPEVQECIQEALISELLSREIPPIQEKKINFKRIQEIKEYARDLRFKELEIIAESVSKKLPKKGADLKQAFYQETQNLLNQKIMKAKEILGDALIKNAFSQISFNDTE